MSEPTQLTQRLIELAGEGDGPSRRELLERYRDHLGRMISARLDRRLAPRVDPSDVVQETLASAANRMDEFFRERPLPFFGWLRQLAGEQLRETHRRHLHAQRRSVRRESRESDLPDDSAMELGRRFVSDDTSPSNRAIREERSVRVMEALKRMPPKDRDLLAMRYLEQLSVGEIAETLAITEGAAKVRLLRALDRLRSRMDGDA